MTEPIRTIRQFVDAGNQFDGTVPSPDPVEGGDGLVLEYQGMTAGGVFDFFQDENRGTHAVKTIALDLGAATDWTLLLQRQLIDGTYQDFTLFTFSDFSAAKVLITGDALTFLHPGDRLKLTTTGATNALIASVDVSPW